MYLKVNKDDLLNNVYYSDQPLRIEILKMLLDGLNDSFDENPPHGKWIDQIRTLEKLIELEGKN